MGTPGSMKVLEFKSCRFTALKVLECELLFLENFDRIMEGYSFELFAMLRYIPVTVLRVSLIIYFKLQFTIL